MSNQYLSFDVTKQSAPQQLITGRQGDSQLKFVSVLLWDGEKNIPYDLTGKQIAFEALKPDGTHIVDYNGITILDAPHGLFRYSFNEQVFTVAGTMQQAFFKITHTDKDSQVIADSTLEVAINVLENRVEFDINSTDYLSEYDDLIEKVKKKFDDYATTVQDSIDKAQALHNQIVEYTNLINSNGVVLRSDFGDISSIKQPLGQTVIDKLNNEFSDRCINVAWFGAIGDGVADDTAALQSAIDYAYDFKWLGSVKATKDAMNSKDIKTVFIPAGNYRITSSLLLAPYVTITGEANQGFTSNKQTSIIGDFISETDAIIDTAPYDVNGNRVKHARFSAEDWKNSLTTGTPGFTLKNISFIASKNANIRAGLHRCGGIQSQVINCSFENGEGRMAIGIDSSLVWNGVLSHNHIVTSLYNLYNYHDITQDVQEFNYLTIRGEKPAIPDYMFPVDDYKGLSANIFSAYADVHYYSNICEHADIGILASYSTNIVDINNYYEDINQFVYVMHSVGGNLSPKWLTTPNADLLKGYGIPKMHIDLTATSYLSVNSIGVIDSYSKVVKISGVTGFKNFSKRIIYVDVVQSGTVKIYVSSTGNDDYTGYSESFPVRTLQGAILRTIQGMQNNIIIKDNDTIETKYSYGDDTNTTTKVIDIPELNIVSDAGSTINVGSSFDEVHGLPSGIAKIIIKNITLNLPTIIQDYKPFATTNSMLDLSIINSKINGGFLAGTKFNVSGFIIATLSSSILTNTTIFASGGDDKNLLFIEKSNLSTFNNSHIGGGTSLFTQDNL